MYAYLSGTSTPRALYADAELTTELPNPVILDASGEALFYYGNATYALKLTDANDVPYWVIDPVTGGGSGGGGASVAAGIGFGQHTVELRPLAGEAQATALVFPPGVLAMAVSVWVSETCGSSQGLEDIGIGTLELNDCWGYLGSLQAATETTAGLFQGYGGQPQPHEGTITLTAYGGVFDGSGEFYVTGHFATFRPSREAGYSYVPPGGDTAPFPLATTDAAGLVELATVAEHLDGLRDDLACTPEGLQAALDAVTGSLPASETQAGIVELINPTEVLENTDLTRALTIGRLVSRTSTEVRSGLTRFATPTETVTGTLATAATHPAGVKAALDAALAPVVSDVTALEATDATHTSQISALQSTDTTHASQISALDTKVPPGTALSVTRYAVGGTTVEATPGVTTLATGEVGMGTAPVSTQPLTVSGIVQISGAARLNVTRDDDTNLVLNSTLYGNTAARVITVQGNRSGGSLAVPTPSTATMVFLRLAGKGHDGVAFPAQTRTHIDLEAAETWTTTAQGSQITFDTTLLGTVTQGERMRIDGTGNVGIATTTPKFPLHVAGALACGVPATAPTDANLANGQMTVWLNGSTLTFRVRDGAGVLKTGTVALT